jgi:hypothetical protein
MSREALEKLLDSWINDPKFREELHANPEEAVRRSGADLDEDEWEALRAMVPGLSDQPLQGRISI